MSCRCCDRMGPMKPYHMLPDAILQSIFHGLKSKVFPMIMLGDFGFEELAQAAELGCSFCTTVKAGVLAFAKGDQVLDVHVAQSVEMSGDEQHGKHRNGCVSLLHVDLKTKCGKKTQLVFYAADGIVTSYEPRFRQGPHIAEDPLSSSCLSKARTWLDHCLRNHSSLRCTPKSDRLLPTRVIDVGTDLSSPFLYESKPGEVGVWAALSYCWGKSQAVTTTLASLTKHKSSLALDTLPSTCRDAILAARAMSIRYVWIDAICIVQDSVEDWQREASRMCFVYENAIITLVAPEAPSSDIGLSISNPRRVTVELDFEMSHNSFRRQGVVYVREAMPSPVFPLHVHRTNPSPKSIINTRAWTMQEILLSSRILWFGSAEIGWSCWSATACECQPRLTFEYLHVDELNPRSALLKISSSPKQTGKSNMKWGKTWCDLVEQYTSRQLTVATDRLPAMSGLAVAVSNHLKSEYLAGIWKSQLSAQLLWYSAWAIQSDSGTYSQALEDDYAPSWTWASVPGSVIFDLNGDVERSSQVWRVVSVDFHHVDMGHFGRGKGSITLESYMWPIYGATTRLEKSSDLGGHVCYNDSPIVDENSIMWDPRPKTRAWHGDDPVNEELWFFAGALVKSSRYEHFVSCKGLVLEHLPNSNVYRRLGGGIAPLGKSASKDWGTWKERAQWATVILI